MDRVLHFPNCLCIICRSSPSTTRGFKMRPDSSTSFSTFEMSSSRANEGASQLSSMSSIEPGRILDSSEKFIASARMISQGDEFARIFVSELAALDPLHKAAKIFFRPKGSAEGKAAEPNVITMQDRHISVAQSLEAVIGSFFLRPNGFFAGARSPLCINEFVFGTHLEAQCGASSFDSSGGAAGASPESAESRSGLTCAGVARRGRGCAAICSRLQKRRPTPCYPSGSASLC
jgi:hypothetical protein